MKQYIIGRQQEQEILEQLYRSKKAEFVVVYGRRRIGKTHLVRELFEDRFSFHHTALSPFEMEETDKELLVRQQLATFGTSLRRFGDYHDVAPKDWFQAFEWLREHLSLQSKRKRLLVFLDELPWMDTPRSGFITAFEHFWNGWGAGQHNLMLVVCGSATSWINDKLINNTSGLYGRTTREIHLSPFTLKECKQFYQAHHLSMNDYDLLQSYMIMGGIPYYMSYMDKSKSLAQNIDNLFFKKSGKFHIEFTRLFQSLFIDPEKHVRVMKLLSKRKMGFTRKEITEITGFTSGGGLTSILQSLEASDFIVKYIPFGESSRNAHYKITDLFSLFYLHFMDSGMAASPTFWQDNQHSPSLNTWRGFAFEEVCFLHHQQMKAALGISGVHCEVSSWRSQTQEDHTQIDMVIDRNDRVVNLCEMKFYSEPFVIDKSYDLTLRHKIKEFLNQTKTKKTPHLTIVTTYGLKQNMYSGFVNSVITMRQLMQ